MHISEIPRQYFQGFTNIKNWKKQKIEKTVLDVLIILSSLTLVVPLVFAALYALSGRVSQKHHLSAADLKLIKQAKIHLRTGNLELLPKPTLPQVLNTYKSWFAPQANVMNLRHYVQSQDFERHARTAKIYYNKETLSINDALRIVFQREPTNIAMGDNQYKRGALQKLFGYTHGAYNEPHLAKENGELFRNLPNTAAVYSETFLWNVPGNDGKQEIACLSIPAPALDSPRQPNYNYYVVNGSLDSTKYRKEIHFLFQIIEKAVRDHSGSAFQGKGLKRVILSKLGQGAFLGALSLEDRQAANTIFVDELKAFLKTMGDLKIPIGICHAEEWEDFLVFPPDILHIAQEGDLIVNAWDPHSAPGNGNDNDPSFDGALGKGSGILPTQTSWLNHTLRSRESVVAM